MTIPNPIAPDRIITDLAASSKQRLLHELSKKAAEALGLDAGEIVDAIVAREKLGSTGVGTGTAIPHARIANLRSPFAIFARLARAIDYESIDGTPVDLVFFVLLPPGRDRENLALLADISKRLRAPEYRARLREAADEDGLAGILSGAAQPKGV